MRGGWPSVLVALLAVLLAPVRARAGEAESRVVVRFAPQLTSADTARLASAMRAQLRDTATLVVGESPAGDVPSGTFVVDVDRTEAGIVLRFRAHAMPTLGAPRVVAREGEIGASEAATIVRAFVVAAIEGETNSHAAGAAADAANAANAPANIEARVEPAATTTPAPPAPSSDGKPARILPPAEASASPAELPVAPWRGRFSALYTGTTFAGELPWQSGVRVEAAYAFVPGL